MKTINPKSESPTVEKSRHFGGARILETSGGRITESLESLDGVTLETMNGEKSAIPENPQVIMEGAGYLWYDKGDLFALVDSRELPGFNVSAFSTHGNYAELIFGKVVKETNGNPKVKPFFEAEVIDPPAPVSVQIPAPVIHSPRVKPSYDMQAIAAPFNALVGMDAAKAIACDNLHANLKGNGPLLSPVILAPAGTGKTAFSLAWQKAMGETGADTMAILPSQIRRLGKEWDAVINFLATPGRKSLFIDEAHELFIPGRTVQLAKIGSLAMAALDGNRPDWQNVKLSDEISIGFDRRECQLILATNFPGKMPEALAGKSGRSFRLELPLYSDSEIAEIARLMLEGKGIKGNEESLQSLARVARGSARPLEHLTAALFTRAILAGKATVNKEDILASMITCGLFPLGFSKEEIRCLEFLKSANTLSVMAARFPNLDSGTLKTFMAHALGNGLAGKTNGGFSLTDKGRRYFTECSKLAFPMPTL